MGKTFVSSLTATAGESVMANFKTSRCHRFRERRFGLFLDETMQLALSDRVEKRAHFAFLAIDLKFHAAVRQVAHPTGNIEAFRGMSHRPAETDALNCAFVENLERNHGMLNCSKAASAEKLRQPTDRGILRLRFAPLRMTARADYYL